MTETKAANGGMLEEWTSYFFPSPSKASQVTCLEFFQRPSTGTTLLCQAVPHRFGVFDATTMALVGQEHPLSAPVRLIRFMDAAPYTSLPSLLLVSTRICIFSLERQAVVHEVVGPMAAKDVLDVRVNDHVLAILSPRVLHLFDRRANFALQATIPTTADAMALGPRWLAFPSALDERHTNGFAASSTATFTARDDYSLTNVAQGVASSLYFLSQVGRKSLSTSFAATSDETRDVGSVVVHDVVHGANLVQFKAHDSPITTLTFDPSGQLLVTSSKKGQTLHVHRLLGDDHVLLYKLQRGITYARIHHVSISVDAKWIAVTSLRGTTHVYAIWPQGGPVDGHCHADMDYDDAPQVAASKAVAVLEQQARDLGRPSWSTEKIQSLLRLRHTTPMNNTATAFQYDDDDLPALHLQCQWGPNNTLYVANAGTLKTMQLQPKLSVLETQSFALSAEMTQLHSVDLEHRPTHPVVQNDGTSTSPTPALSSVEVKTHHRPSIPLWAHPKITFRAVRHADDSSRVLSVRRLGPVPLPTDAADKVHERVTQGESPVFDGAAKPKKQQQHLIVPSLDLAASISKAVQSSVEIAPIDDHGLDAGVQSLNLAHIQDTYFASPPLAPLSDLVSVHVVLPPVLSDVTDTSLDEPFEEIVAETSTTHDDPPRAKSKGRRGSKVKAK